MKKLYFLNEEESTRILNFHKESTKRQYLSETIIDGKYKSQSYDYIYVDFEKNTIELNGPLQCENRSGEIGDNELGLLKGTVFSMENANTLITSPKQKYQFVDDMSGGVWENYTGKIRYWCSSKNFGVEDSLHKTDKFWGENFSIKIKNGFNDMCDHMKKAATIQETPLETAKRKSLSGITKLTCLKNGVNGIKLMITPNGEYFYMDSEFRYKTAFNITSGTAWKQPVKIPYTPAGNLSPGGWVEFYCEDYIVEHPVTTTEDDFKTNLPCISRAKGFKLMTSTNNNIYFQDNNWKYWATGEKQPINYKLSDKWTPFTCKDVQSKPTYKKPSIVPALNKEIQTSIGTDTPTGKLTDADYRLILTKLQQQQ